MDPEKIMNSLSQELESAFKAMAKAKTVEEKLQHSQIVRNLCESLGVFFNLATEMMPEDFDDEII
ncbi:MAG: hypothetical protein ACOY32_07520 [Thermodesulfobacteriota bacterium]